MKVAFSKIIITPKDYLGRPMAGYSRKHPCLGLLDNLHAYGALVEFNNRNPLLLISVDILKLPLSIVEYLKKRLISKFKALKSELILVHATHTHSSFDLTGEFYYQGGTFGFMKGVMFADNKSDDYIVWIVHRIISMVDDLFKNLKPCKIAWNKKGFNPDLVINRRWPLRKTIPDLGIISFKSQNDNELIGIIISYACHPTTLSYLNYKLSADYPGKIISRFEELTNKKTKVIYINGPSGDINPITTSGTNFNKIEKDKTLTYDQLGTYEHTKKIGYKIAEEALKMVQSIGEDEFTEIESINISKKELLIPQKDAKYFSKVWLSNKLKWIIKKAFLFKIAKFDKERVNFPLFTTERKHFRNYGKTIIEYLNLKAKNGKKLGILTIPGELFEDIGKNLSQKSPNPSKDIFIFQNTQDWIGYLFNLETYIKEGGYEPFMCYSPLCGEYIEKCTIKLFKNIKNKI